MYKDRILTEDQKYILSAEYLIKNGYITREFANDTLIIKNNKVWDNTLINWDIFPGNNDIVFYGAGAHPLILKNALNSKSL